MDNIKVPDYQPEMFDNFLVWLSENDPEMFSKIEDDQLELLHKIYRTGFYEGMRNVVYNVLMGSSSEAIWGAEQ